MRAVFIFEFGLPPYRKFSLDHLKERFSNLKVFTGTDRFVGWPESNEVRLKEIVGIGENRLYFLSPSWLADADVIFTTFNLRRPHTWIWVFLFPKKRWIFFGQGTWQSRNSFANLVRKFLLKVSSGYVAYTGEGADSLESFGYPPKKIRVARNTLAVSNAGWTDGESYFLYVGRLQERKELLIAIKALSSTNAKFKIVGDGEILDDLKRLVQTNNLQDRVTFHPGVYDDIKLKGLFEGAIAYLSPGALGLGVVHAFSYAVPVVTLADREHGPEFAYCNDSNSYICANETRLAWLLNTLEPRSQEHVKRKIAALKTYETLLSPENMLRAFEDLAFEHQCGDRGNEAF